MYMDGATDILGVAQDVALARKQWNLCQQAIHACPELEEEWEGVRNVNGDEWFRASGATYAIKAANDKAGRGGTNDEVNIDELRVQHDWKAWAACSKTTNARPNGQTWAMSNMGGEEAVVLNQLRESALTGRNPMICLLEWSGEDGCELDDWDQLAQANPSLGYGFMTEEALLNDVLNEPPDIVRTEILCQKVDALNSAVDQAGWRACADEGGTMDGLRDRICAVFDVSPDGQHATLATAALTDTGKPRIEIAGDWPGMAAASAELPGLLEQIRPAWFGWYPGGPSAGMAPVLRAQAVKWNARAGKPRNGEPPGPPADGELKGAAPAEACQGLASLAKGRALIHSDDPMLNTQITAARKLQTGDSWRFTRDPRAGAGHVDGAYAAAGAAQAALILPAPRRARIRLLA